VKLFIKNFLMSSDVSTEGEIMTWFDTFSETEARNTEPKTHFYRHLLRPVRDAAATFVVFAGLGAARGGHDPRGIGGC
jgi:hypothetical protein